MHNSGVVKQTHSELPSALIIRTIVFSEAHPPFTTEKSRGQEQQVVSQSKQRASTTWTQNPRVLFPNVVETHIYYWGFPPVLNYTELLAVYTQNFSSLEDSSRLNDI